MSLVFLPVSQSGVPQMVPTLTPALTPYPQPIVLAQPQVYDPGFLSHATKRNNEDAILAGSVDNGAKKMKTEHFDPKQVSKVIHLRSLPSDVTEAEVIQLGMNFGKVTNLLMLKGKNQAFVELESSDDAAQMVATSDANPPTVRQRVIYVQFSNHKELKTDNSPNQQKAQSVLQAMQQTEGGLNHVLRVLVENMLYPITLDVLHTIFSKFGVVLKIITFNKNDQFQALLQMGDAMQTNTAKLSLDGQNIYNSCCTLRIEYSKLTSLNVKFNNDKSRDYMRNDLPTGEGGLLSPMPGILSGGLMPLPSSHSQVTQAVIASALQQIPPGPSFPGFPPRNNTPSSVAAHLAAFVGVQNAVLHVSNLNEEMVTPQALFILFGVYGDVIRVKILFQRKNNALVQMQDFNQAQTVIRFLHGVKLCGRALQVVMSKHGQVQMPRDGQEMAKLTQDYTNSPLHRFKKPGSKNFQNIFAPSEVLHLSNIPPETTEDSIRETFNEHGKVQGFKFFLKDRKMALIQLSSIEEAVKCLVALHNFKLSDTNHLRVSFSKGHI